jgi:L-amino acid N-acyltransferase YncA
MIAFLQDPALVQEEIGVELRRVTPADREALVEMYLSFEPKGAAMGLPPRKNVDKWLDSLAGHSNFVVLLEGHLVGHGALCSEAGSGEVAVFIHQDHRSCGLGKLLLGEMVNEARRLGLRKIWGIADLDNIPMLRLAHSLGFVRGVEPWEFHIDLTQPAPAHDEFSPS